MFYKKTMLSCLFGCLIALPIFPCFAAESLASKNNKETILDQFTKYAEQVRKDWHVPGGGDCYSEK